MFVIGLLIAIIIYPFLHEAGHSLSAFLFGVEVIDFRIFPIASVLLKMNVSISDLHLFAIGVSGIIFPFLISLLLPSKSFWMWYMKTALRLICAISFVIEIVSAIMFEKGSSMQNDDTAILLKSLPHYTTLLLVLLTILLFIAIIFLVNDFIVFNKRQLYKAF